MTLNLDYEFLFLGRDESIFSENYVCDFLEESGEKAGYIFANVEIKNNPSDAEVIGVSIYETMQREFFKNLSLDPYERFEATLKELNRILKEFKAQRESSYIGDMNIIVGAFVGDTLFITQTGEAEAYLVRKRYLSIISDGLNDEKDDDVFANIASGKIENGDFVFLSSTRLLRYISKNDFTSIIKKGNVQATLTDLRDLIFTEVLGKLSVVGVNFSQDIVSETLEMNENRIEEVLEIDNGEEFVHEENVLTVDDLVSSSKKRELRNKKYLNISAFSSKFKNLFSSFSGSKIESKNKLLIALLGIISILVISIVIASATSDKRKEAESLEKVLEGVQTKISDAKTKGDYDKETAIALLDKAFDEAMEVHKSGYLRDSANLYLAEIENVRDSLDNVTRVSDLAEYVDLSDRLGSNSAKGFAVLGDRVFIYNTHDLLELVLNEMQDSISIDSEEQIISATGFDSRGSVVFLTESGKLIEYRDGAVSYMDTEDGQFKPAVSLADWGDRIYLLDDKIGQIWKYTYKTNKNEFSIAESYLADVDARLIGAKDLDIDASIYLLAANGEILRYYGGQDASLSIYNEPFNSFSSANKIYTRDTLNKVFVLDGENSRLFVFEKDDSTGRLNYLSQYLFDGIDSVDDFYVNNEGNKIYILALNKVYELSI